MTSILLGDNLDVLPTLPDCSINCCVTSPPYWGLRDYHIDGQIGLEETPDAYIQHLCAVFAEVRRVLRDDGTLWLNLGDTYASRVKGTGGGSDKQRSNTGSRYDVRHLLPDVPDKNLLGIPWRVALALQAAGWYLRSDIIWAKPNPMPESVTDRPTKSHEYMFLLSKSDRYYYDAQAIAEPAAESTIERLAEPTLESQHGSDRVPGKTNGPMKACPPRYGGKKYTETPDEFYSTKSGNAYQYKSLRNKRDVWTVATAACNEAHFATFPPELIRPCILAGCPQGGVVLDPFLGSGTTAMVCKEEGRDCVGIELNEEYCAIARRRIDATPETLFATKEAEHV